MTKSVSQLLDLFSVYKMPNNFDLINIFKHYAYTCLYINGVTEEELGEAEPLYQRIDPYHHQNLGYAITVYDS